MQHAGNGIALYMCDLNVKFKKNFVYNTPLWLIDQKYLKKIPCHNQHTLMNTYIKRRLVSAPT